MKKIICLLIVLLAFDVSYGQSEIIISQYIETTSGTTPKGIEITNVSGYDITFSVANNLQIFQGSNGAACSALPGTNITTGTLLANEVWVIGTNDLTAYASTNGLNLSGTTNYGFNFNGNDALQLFLGGVIQDEFGMCGNNPGVSWSNGGVETRNNNIELINGLCDGDTNGWTDPSERFTQIANGQTMTGFGNAPSACCVFISTWDTGGWTPSAPTRNSSVIINAPYDTSINGNIIGCSLTVNSTLTVNDLHYVEIENDVIVDGGTLTVESQGAFVQNGIGTSAGTFSIINSGNAIVNKSTRSYTYNEGDDGLYFTYWSSPVTSADITTIFPNPAMGRRNSFNGANFLDEHTTGTTNGIPDDIDDNYNDWETASGIMIPGMGYAVTAVSPKTLPGPRPITFNDIASFSGLFNSGDISISIYRNDDELADKNWNLIGNPYPSAISASDFFDVNHYDATLNPNGTIEGVIYFWTHNTTASSLNNGHDANNFSQDDYAYLNQSGAAGPALSGGVTPNDFIPSGQGFMVSYDNNAPTTAGSSPIFSNTVKFDNSMRMADITSNSQFFKNTLRKETSISSKNRIWVNLTSDNGIFNQVLVAYINGATKGFDGLIYDALRNTTVGSPAILYTKIEANSGKFVIQGKNTLDLNEDETISLGFETTVDVATLYKLSIAKLEGTFLSNNDVYLIDKLLNKIHNLSESDYSFTSEVGEFNDRFEIVFNENALLSTDDFASNQNDLSIIQLGDDKVKFSVTNSTLKSIAVFDVLGRELYNLKADSNSETYTLSNLKNSVYIAKVTLANGTVITKKALKK